MPSPGRPPRERRGAPIDQITWSFLLDERGIGGDMDLFMLNRSGEQRELRELWAAVGDAVITTFADAHPGHRPLTWWKFSAPEMRRRIGGQGTVESDLLAVVPRFERGIPVDWIEDDWIWTYNGGTAPEAYVPFNREDPPRFESQATFLRRHKLVLPGELRRLKAADFEPEIVIVEAVSPADIDDPTGGAGPTGSSPLIHYPNRTSFES
jgi:hypothetical protein